MWWGEGEIGQAVSAWNWKKIIKWMIVWYVLFQKRKQICYIAFIQRFGHSNEHEWAFIGKNEVFHGLLLHIILLDLSPWLAAAAWAAASMGDGESGGVRATPEPPESYSSSSSSDPGSPRPPSASSAASTLWTPETQTKKGGFKRVTEITRGRTGGPSLPNFRKRKKGRFQQTDQACSWWCPWTSTVPTLSTPDVVLASL